MSLSGFDWTKEVNTTTNAISDLLQTYLPTSPRFQHLLWDELAHLAEQVEREVSGIYTDRLIESANESSREKIKLLFALTDAVKEGEIVFPKQEQIS